MIYYTKSRRRGSFGKIFRWLGRLRLLIVLFFIVSALAYFWQINSLSVRGFEIKDLEGEIRQLKRENQKLEMDATAEQSMFNLDERIRQLNFAAVQKIEYLQTAIPLVAVK